MADQPDIQPQNLAGFILIFQQLVQAVNALNVTASNLSEGPALHESGFGTSATYRDDVRMSGLSQTPDGDQWAARSPLLTQTGLTT